MSNMAGKILVQNDIQLRINQTATGTLNGAAQNKKTATDLLLTIIALADGANAVGGTTTVTLQGSNVTGSASSNWTNVTPDKGTLANITASGVQTVHAAQLQFQYYRVLLSGNASATVNVATEFAYHPVEDSFDATVQ